MEEKLIIPNKTLKGEDVYKIFSVRIKDDTVKKLDSLAQTAEPSRNELINIMLEYALKNCEVK
mgnify:CR=1 FL=1